MNNLTTVLSHLPENKIKELSLITERIKATNLAEIIILFGSYARGDYKEKRGEKQGKKSDYDILVIYDDVIERELKDKLNDAFSDIKVHVQLIYEDIDIVNSHLKDREFFFSDIQQEGKILYDSGKFGYC